MKNKKILLLICGLLLCICVALIAQTYAKYLSSAQSTSSINVASWNINVNNQAIVTSSDFSSVVEPVFPGNDYIAANIIAPTAEGYFDLVLDFSQVDVAFNYKISTSVNANSSVKDLVVTGYSIDGGEIINSNEPITEDIMLSSNIDTRTIRIYLVWDDSATSSMDNLSDTAISNTGKAMFDVNINFTQLASK